MQENYHIITPKTKKVPILVSVPHCGTAIPEDLLKNYRKEMLVFPDDTDFFVQDVYDFVPDLGITMIYSHYNRWVIDLNRSPQNQALYTDGRLITGLTSTTDFLGNPLYVSKAAEPDTSEIQRRKLLYYAPYYEQVSTILKELKNEFGFAILWDGHSIRKLVPTIQAQPFPHFILGTNDGLTASDALIQTAKKGLSSRNYALSYNHPFKGGNITRHFGNPKEGIHALQLEMIKTLYMDDREILYHPERANELRKVLKYTFELLIEEVRRI